MNKALTGLLIGLAFLAPAVASAKSQKDTTPPSLTSIHIASTNADPSRAKAGDTVTLTFTASEKVTPIVLVETRALFVRARNTSGNSWEASYVVNPKDRTGRVDYLITLVDASKNGMVCSSARLPFIKYCPTTDGSSVTIYREATTTPDTTAPVIAAHEDIQVTTEGASAEVSYILPAATDNVDASVAVICSPASGSSFTLGTTTVTCSAQDAAGNQATSTFAVTVTQEVVEEPTPYTMAQQADESYLCGADTGSWRYCDGEATFSFTDAVGQGTKTIDLGAGSGMGEGAIETITIAKDPSLQYEHKNLFRPWTITITCFEDAAHTVACPDWETISDDANDNESQEGKYWSADFSALSRAFRQDAYYVMTIVDQQDWETPAFGSLSLQTPYYKIVGLH